MISLYILSIILILSFPDSQVKADCTLNGHKLYGKIKFVDDFPDIKIKIVENFPDLKVQLVENFPNSCGKWQIVDNLPDLKVKIVTDIPDIKVKFINDFPGIPLDSKIQKNNY